MERKLLRFISFSIISLLMCVLCLSCEDSYVPYEEEPSDCEIPVPKLKSLKFLASDNPEVLVTDVVCDIEGNIVEGLIPHVVYNKQLIPTIEYDGDELTIDGEKFKGKSKFDFSKPIKLVVSKKERVKSEYVINVRAFTGLPVVYINTEDNVEITSKEEYVNATIRIVEDLATRSSNYDWSSNVQVKGRGNTTWFMPKKPYKLKFSEKVSLLGEPKDKEWVLLANYSDKTVIRNELAFFMGRMSAMPYTCRTHYVELFINNCYVGTYQLGEQQKVSKSRVNVGDDGYLIEIDAKAASDDITFTINSIDRPINIKDPNVEIGDEKYNYIVDYLKQTETALFSNEFTNEENGYAKYIDVSTFVDWYIINEIAKNNDAMFHASCYIHLKPGGKLCMGPLWDFDIAFGNINYNNNETPEGFWVKKVSWYTRLFQDPVFVAKVKNRFDYFYSNKNVIFNEINENAKYLKYSVIENDAVWNTLNSYVWPNYVVLGSYENEVAYLKQWLNARLEWLKKEFDAM